MKEGYAGLVDQVRRKKPLVHHITNYVTVNDCANITLGIGASPIMADALEEAAEIAAISSALVLNMGTLNARTIPAMIAAGKAANRAGIPVVFDPVGAGASRLRNDTAAQVLAEVKLGVLRGNISEMRFLAGLTSETRGVDASDADLQGSGEAKQVAKALAAQLGCVTAITGAVDVASDGWRVLCVENGHPMLSRLTGTGCMCTSLMGAFCGAAPGQPLAAATAALLAMGIAGEIAFAQAGDKGSGSFRVALHDAICLMDAKTLGERAKVYEAED